MTKDQELVEKFGTPLYIYDLDRVVAAHADLRAALPDAFELYYSFKANPHPDIARCLREVAEKPCRAEVCSTGELDSAVEAGYEPGGILYGGPGKTDVELIDAISRGVRHFSVESYSDLSRVGRIAESASTVVDCLLRINSAESGSTTSIRMTGRPSQFGIDAETVEEQAEVLLSVPGTRVVGLHFFPLSNAHDEDSLIAEFQASIAAAADIAERAGIPMRLLDIGGGFGAPYAVPGERPRYPNLRAALEQALDEHFPQWRAGEVTVACESGRHLVGDSGRLLLSVVNVKHSRGRVYAVADAGVNVFGGMAGLGRLLPLAVEPVDSAGNESTVKVSLVGPLCTPGDVLGAAVPMPEPEAGDVIAVPNAGAYGPTASLLLFLGRPAPAEVVVAGGDIKSATRVTHVRDALA